MSESLKHKKLVLKMKEYVEKKYSVESINVRCDLQEYTLPAKVLNHIPDLYFEDNETIVIGEAKTSNDFDREHSMNQYEDFMKMCSLSSKKAVFIIIIPWTEFVSAKNLFRRKKRENNYKFEIIVINELNEVECI